MNNPLSVHEVASKLDGDRLRDYRLEALPSERDALLRRFLTQLASEPPEGRAEIGAGLNDEVRLALTLFAVRMAELAVRQSDQSAILDGLRALVLQMHPDDWRDLVIATAPLFRSATLLGANVAALFDQAADFASSEIGPVIRSFPSRPDEQRRFEAFGFREEGSGEAFRYVSKRPTVDDPAVQDMLRKLRTG